MIKRIVEVAKPSSLSIRNRQLIIKQADTSHSVPLEDIGLLILDHPQITCSQGLLVACGEYNIAFILCGSNHLPCSLLLSLVGNTLQTKFLGQQIQAKLPVKKRLWQSVIKAKIKAQAAVLASLKERSLRLENLVNIVKSGDTRNAEAQASRIYWPSLFGKDFRRHQDAGDINMLLNYGYAILRAAVARALVGAGLHPSMGIHHSNQYNPFCLADDLMEPLRPLIDMRVYEIKEKEQNIATLEQPHKQALLECLTWQVKLNKAKFPLMVALHEYAAATRQCLAGERDNLFIPVL